MCNSYLQEAPTCLETTQVKKKKVKRIHLSRTGVDLFNAVLSQMFLQAVNVGIDHYESMALNIGQ